MSEHTPGPWVAQEWDGDTCLVEALSPDGKMVEQEICHVLNPEDDQPTTKANLNLIAAAPDLLAALKNAVAQMEALATYAKRPGMSRSDIALARAAIAKAEGKS